MNYTRVKIKSMKTASMGTLSFFEGGTDKLGFEIKRFYYIYGVSKDTKRGGHAHKRLRQLLFCPYGIIKIILDDGKEKRIEILDNPSEGLLLEAGIWRDMYWEVDDAVLCVAASEFYDENDYIRNYEEFLKWKGEDR